MPPYNHFRCSRCRFSLPSGWGGIRYVTDENGQKIICPHPGDFFQIYEVLGESASGELVDQRTGFNSDCLCLDCLAKFQIDLKREQRICPKCRSNHVNSVKELVGEPCPKCKDGTVQEIETGSFS